MNKTSRQEDVRNEIVTKQKTDTDRLARLFEILLDIDRNLVSQGGDKDVFKKISANGTEIVGGLLQTNIVGKNQKRTEVKK